MSKLTPAQRALWRRLAQREHYDEGLPVDQAHKATLAALVRRGVAVVMYDRAFWVAQP